MKKIDVRYIPQVKNQFFGYGGPGAGDEFVGGHDEYLESFTTKQACLKYAKRISKSKRINDQILHEIYVRIEGNNIAEHWYFKNGIQTFYDKFKI